MLTRLWYPIICPRAPVGAMPSLTDGVWAVFDFTEQGLAMAVLTAVAGPAAEVLLINVLHLYHYNNPDFWGIPSWITWVYFCGSPAVVGLGM